MFIGHFGAGFGAKALAPKTSLGTLFFAAQFIDLLWPTLLLMGVERVVIRPGITAVVPLDFVHYPVSHSLLMVIVWGLLIGGLYGLIRKRWGAAMVVAALVVSHWLLDLIVHRPDPPLYPGDAPMVGLGLWGSLTGTLIVEGLVFGMGLAFYVRTTRARDGIGRYGFWGLVGFLVLVHIGNLFGDPPPDSTAIAWVGQLQWLLVIWGYWIDRHREAAPRADAAGAAHSAG